MTKEKTKQNLKYLKQVRQFSEETATGVQNHCYWPVLTLLFMCKQTKKQVSLGKGNTLFIWLIIFTNRKYRGIWYLTDFNFNFFLFRTHLGLIFHFQICLHNLKPDCQNTIRCVFVPKFSFWLTESLFCWSVYSEIRWISSTEELYLFTSKHTDIWTEELSAGRTHFGLFLLFILPPCLSTLRQPECRWLIGKVEWQVCPYRFISSTGRWRMARFTLEDSTLGGRLLPLMVRMRHSTETDRQTQSHYFWVWIINVRYITP